MSDAAVGNLLKIVRRQPMILVTDKSLEKMPGLSRDPADARRSSSLSVKSRTCLGRLTQNATTGESNQPARKGLAAQSADGRMSPTTAALAAASARVPHMPARKSRSPVPSRCSVDAAVSHSSSLRRVTSSRARVRTTASHISRA